MGRIVVSSNITLDGVVEDPTGAEGFLHGGWFDRVSDADRAAWAEVGHDEAVRAAALLLGRRSDAFFGARWNSRTGPWADRLRALPKYVVSTTLVDPVWANSTVVAGLDAVSALRRDTDGELVVYASRVLVRTLLARDLVDELRLTVFPVVLGTGARLFDGCAVPVRLRSARVIGDGLAHLTYSLR